MLGVSVACPLVSSWHREKEKDIERRKVSVRVKQLFKIHSKF